MKIDGNKFIICGGVTSKLSKLSNKVFLFNSRKYDGYELVSMKRSRYAFSAIWKKPYIYVIGGREYGDDQDALMPYCERLNPR